MIPTIALVGRANVGKSTLFNRLTKTRDALVADFPGLTRDRKYGKANLGGSDFILIDTGGIDGEEFGIEIEMADQAMAAIAEADLIFFIVDVKLGLNPGDFSIAKHLRQQNKNTIIVANKVDGIDADSHLGQFYELGFEHIYPIAASQGRGIKQLVDALPNLLGEEFIAFSENQQKQVAAEQEIYENLSDEERLAKLHENIKIAIVGRPNVGKSTLTNRILGEERVIVYDMPGTTRDSIYIEMERSGQKYTLIDTAGVRRRGKVNLTVEKFSVIKTLKAIEDCNVAILVIDGADNISDQDLSLLGFILNSGRALVIAVNKWDDLDQDKKNEIKNELDRRLGFINFARIHFISALKGTGVDSVFYSINEAYKSATTRFNTALLTRILRMATDEHQPPLSAGRRTKLKYAHAGGYNPPIVVIHGNMTDRLNDSYKRYLTNYFRQSLKIIGTPIRLEFQDSENPFAGKRNTLTPNQMRKRARLMSYIKKNKK